MLNFEKKSSTSHFENDFHKHFHLRMLIMKKNQAIFTVFWFHEFFLLHFFWFFLDLFRSLGPLCICGTIFKFLKLTVSIWLQEEEEIAHNILENLMTWSGKSLGQDFKVYHVHQLFYYLSQYLPKDLRFSNCHLAEEEINNDVFNYISGLGCKYHDWYDIPRWE